MNLAGAGLEVYLLPPAPFFDTLPPKEGRPIGVDRPFDAGSRFCCFRKGDSGRGREGLDLGLSWGLAIRGPTDWLNLCIAGVGGVWAFMYESPLGALRLNPPAEGVVGVKLNEAEDKGEERFVARLSGRKIPAPGTEVVKYRILGFDEHNI